MFDVCPATNREQGASTCTLLLLLLQAFISQPNHEAPRECPSAEERAYNFVGMLGIPQSSNLAAGKYKSKCFLSSLLPPGEETCPQKVCRRGGRKRFFYSSKGSLLPD